MKRIILLALLIIASFGFGQEPIIEWEKSLGGSQADLVKSIELTTDGGYILTGMTSSDDGDISIGYGSIDYWIVKIDELGNVIWQKTFGGSGVDNPSSIKQTNDGGYIVTGDSDSNDGNVIGNQGNRDYWILKLDAAGNISWQRSLGGSGLDMAESVQQTTDGGYIVAGRSTSSDGDVTGNNGGVDVWVVKLDEFGSITWQKSLGGSEEDHVYSIQQTTDGGYIFSGNSTSIDGDVTGNNGGMDCWIVKLDSSGNITWQKSLGGTEDERTWSIKQTSDNGYIAAGWSRSNDGDLTENKGEQDYWVVKLDSSGNITWQNSLGGSDNDRAYSVVQDADGGYIIAGESASYDGDITGSIGDSDFWIVKLDQTGNIIWEKSLGGTGYDRPWSIRQTTESGYIIGGQSNSTDGDISNNIGYTDFWVVKLSPELSSIDNNENLAVNIYPNPTKKIFTISSDEFINSNFTLVDVRGKEALNGSMNGKERSIDISELSKGLYSVVFDNPDLPVLSVIKE